MIVGDNDKGYGQQHPSVNHCAVMLKELEGQLDLERLHFWKNSHPQLIALLQVSSVHVYPAIPSSWAGAYWRRWLAAGSCCE